jgi:hypothetical protein
METGRQLLPLFSFCTSAHERVGEHRARVVCRGGSPLFTTPQRLLPLDLRLEGPFLEWSFGCWMKSRLLEYVTYPQLQEISNADSASRCPERSGHQR